jgi:hypothetical protein
MLDVVSQPLEVHVTRTQRDVQVKLSTSYTATLDGCRSSDFGIIWLRKSSTLPAM